MTLYDNLNFNIFLSLVHGSVIYYPLNASKKIPVICENRRLYNFMYAGRFDELSLESEDLKTLKKRLSLTLKPTVFVVYLKNSANFGAIRHLKTLKIYPSKDQWMLIDKKRRNAIRKAIKLGVNVKLLQRVSSEELATLYKLHYIFYVKHGLRPLPLKAFIYLISNDISRVFVAYLDNKILGFAIALIDHKDNRLYYAYPAWSDEALKYNVPSILAWEMIKYASERNMVFDFSGISTSDRKQANIAFFKKSFGGVEESYYEIKFLLFLGFDFTWLYMRIKDSKMLNVLKRLIQRTL